MIWYQRSNYLCRVVTDVQFPGVLSPLKGTSGQVRKDEPPLRRAQKRKPRPRLLSHSVSALKHRGCTVSRVRMCIQALCNLQEPESRTWLRAPASGGPASLQCGDTVEHNGSGAKLSVGGIEATASTPAGPCLGLASILSASVLEVRLMELFLWRVWQLPKVGASKHRPNVHLEKPKQGDLHLPQRRCWFLRAFS